MRPAAPVSWARPDNPVSNPGVFVASAHFSPAWSAPEASHRCCQVSPEKVSSQSSNSPTAVNAMFLSKRKPALAVALVWGLLAVGFVVLAEDHHKLAHPGDPVTFTGTTLLFVAIGVAACYVPIRRATRIDAMEALRYE